MNQTIQSSWANEIIIAINHFSSISLRIHIVIQADVLILQHEQFRRHIRATDHVNSRWLLSQIWLRQWWCKTSDLSTQKFRMQLESQLAFRHLLSLWLSFKIAERNSRVHEYVCNVILNIDKLRFEEVVWLCLNVAHVWEIWRERFRCTLILAWFFDFDSIDG